ncbi:cyclic GMP-AMP synthase-like [Clytia hemisphaerica]|uniref:Uncharacterized protein n=1 Tax=Clytia hemisphaerica TaxID=252671 RepID=A0A7M6DP72_9CNID
MKTAKSHLEPQKRRNNQMDSNSRSSSDQKKFDNKRLKKTSRKENPYKANIELPDADSQKPDWHKNKKDEMETYYTAIGKTPKEEMKITERHVTPFLGGLKTYIKDMRMEPFKKEKKPSEKQFPFGLKVDLSSDDKRKLTEAEKLLKAKGRRHDWCKEYLHTGSVYEGLKATAELEYDVMFIMKGDKFYPVKVGEKFPCHFKLIQNPEKRQRSLLNNLLTPHQVKAKGGEGWDEMILSPSKVIQKFESVVHKYINSLKEKKKKLIEEEKFGKVKKGGKERNNEWLMKVDDYVIRRHGPAIQVDMMRKDADGKEKLWYQVDLVPCYELVKGKEKRLYVAKPAKITTEKGDRKFVLENSWRMSFSREEKEKLNKMDKDQGCRRQVVRFLKGMTQSDPTLKGMTSYYWKNVLFHLTDNEEARKWRKEDFTERVFDMIWYMSRFVEHGILPLYFSPTSNLFQDMEKKTGDRIRQRLSSLYSKEKKFGKVFESISKKAEEELTVEESQPPSESTVKATNSDTQTKKNLILDIKDLDDEDMDLRGEIDAFDELDFGDEEIDSFDFGDYDDYGYEDSDSFDSDPYDVDF